MCIRDRIQLAQTNHALMPGIETMFLATSIKWSYLSSTIVKEAAYYGSDISKFVTPLSLIHICKRTAPNRFNKK